MYKNHTVKHFCLLIFTILFIGCQETTDVPPGISIESGDIATFSGDTILLKSTVSDEVGIKKITLECTDWDIKKLIDLSGQNPRVFIINEQLFVPQNAGMNFSVNLNIIIESVSGKITEKTLPVAYLPDTNAPVWVNYTSDIAVDFDVEIKSGTANLVCNLFDNRGLVDATLEIPLLSYTKTVSITGKTYAFTDQIGFTSTGTFPATLKATDLTGNMLIRNFSIVVMPVELEDPISNYASMYCIIADDSPDNYIIGYYKPMAKTADYSYTVKVYAEKDHAKIAFVPARSITGDYFGSSPYVSSKLLNKNGYVQPINLPVKGYYTVSINILNKSYTVERWTPTGTNSYANQVCMFANNDIAWGAWVPSPVMTPETGNSFILKGVIPITGAAGTIVQWMCFATANWSMTWRPDGDTPDATSGWWASAGGGKSLNITSTGPGDYPVVFDMAPTIGTDGMWTIIKKP